MDWHDFIAFLHKEGTYKEYRNEFCKYCLKNSIPIQEHVEFVKNGSDIFFLTASFHWNKANKGVMFWLDINRKWLLYRNGLE